MGRGTDGRKEATTRAPARQYLVATRCHILEFLLLFQAASQPLQQFWWSGPWVQFTCPPSNSLSHLSSLQHSGEVIDGRARSTRLAGDEKPRGTRDLGDLGLLAMHCMTATEFPIARPPKRGPLGALPCQPETRCLCEGFLIGRVGARNRDSPHRCVARSTDQSRDLHTRCDRA